MRVDPQDARKRELAQIHMAKAALGWDDDHYRAILLAKTGKPSASELDSTGRKRFIEHLRLCGWKAPQKPFTQADKIKWLWRKLGAAGALTDPSSAALMAFVGRTAGMAVSDLKFLPVREGIKVVEALKSWLDRANTNLSKRGAR